MGHFVASSVTGGVVPAVHVGLNNLVATYTLGETASGSVTIAICRLPAGAKIVDSFLATNHGNLGTGAEQIRLYDSLGNTHMETANISNRTNAYKPTFASQGIRLTGSANILLQLCAAVGTGTSSTQFSLSLTYKTQDSGD